MRQLSYVIALLATGSGVALMTAAGCFPFGDEPSGGTTSTGAGVPCTSVSTCADDGNVCTAEACTNDLCTHTPLTLAVGPGAVGCTAFACKNGVSMPTSKDGDACGIGLKCFDKVCTGCTADKDCGPTDECKTSICQSDMTCKYDYKPSGTKVVSAKLPDIAGDCMATSCNGAGTIELVADAMDVPDDNVCTDGQCVNGAPVQTPLAVGTACANGTTFCNASKTCVACTTNAGCATGTTCYQETGCVSCSDGVRNGDETDVDCGGSCSPCDDKLACALTKDCKSMKCENGACISCFDVVKNGGEADIDCGGTSLCLACQGTMCSAQGQCALGFCEDKVCCNMACTAPCKFCNGTGMCSSEALGFADPACPPATPVCQGGGCVNDMGKNPLGAMCGMNSDCFSGNCQGSPKTCK